MPQLIETDPALTWANAQRPGRKSRSCLMIMRRAAPRGLSAIMRHRRSERCACLISNETGHDRRRRACCLSSKACIGGLTGREHNSTVVLCFHRSIPSLATCRPACMSPRGRNLRRPSAARSGASICCPVCARRWKHYASRAADGCTSTAASSQQRRCPAISTDVGRQRMSTTRRWIRCCLTFEIAEQRRRRSSAARCLSPVGRGSGGHQVPGLLPDRQEHR